LKPGVIIHFADYLDKIAINARASCGSRVRRSLILIKAKIAERVLACGGLM
jgi:hypothetical protein